MKHDLGTVAYIAGFLDGEGHIAIERSTSKSLKRIITPHYTVRVTIANTDRPVLDWIANIWGGNVYRQQRQCVQEVFSWAITNRQVVTEFLSTMLPHLKVKRDQAELMLDYLAQITVRRSYGRGTMPESEAALRQGFHEQIVALHHPQRMTERPPSIERPKRVRPSFLPGFEPSQGVG